MGNNDPSIFEATASGGNLAANLSTTDQVFLGDVSASGSVDISDEAALVGLTNTVAGESVTLAGDGFMGQSGAALQAPTILFTDTDTSDSWVLGPGEATPGGYPAITYATTSSLSVDGGETFNVTPSATTAFIVSGSDPACDSLTYDGLGQAVSGELQPPSGVIQESGLQPVTFSGMTTVDIADAASGGGVYTIPSQPGSGSGGSTGSSNGGPGAGQSPGGTVSGNSPGTNATTSSSGSNPPASALPDPSSPQIVCHLRAPTGRLRREPAGAGKAASFALYLSCDQPASFSLTGTVKLSVGTPKRTYALASERGNTRASGETKLIVLIPHVILVAMNHHARASVSFTLTAKASSSDTTARTNIALR